MMTGYCLLRFFPVQTYWLKHRQCKTLYLALSDSACSEKTVPWLTIDGSIRDRTLAEQQTKRIMSASTPNSFDGGDVSCIDSVGFCDVAQMRAHSTVEQQFTTPHYLITLSFHPILEFPRCFRQTTPSTRYSRSHVLPLDLEWCVRYFSSRIGEVEKVK